MQFFIVGDIFVSNYFNEFYKKAEVFIVALSYHHFCGNSVKCFVPRNKAEKDNADVNHYLVTAVGRVLIIIGE